MSVQHHVQAQPCGHRAGGSKALGMEEVGEGRSEEGHAIGSERLTTVRARPDSIREVIGRVWL